MTAVNFAPLFDGEIADFIDLTHPMKVGMPVWPTHPPFCQEVIESIERGDVACNHALCLSEHSGTHFDAPLHFVLDGKSIDEMSLSRFFGRMATIDARHCAPRDTVDINQIIEFEEKHGSIKAGDAVFFHFGWDRYWNDPAPHERFLRDWPGLSQEASEYLRDRRVGVVGCDCLSIDPYGSANFPAHNILLGAGILVGENFANLGHLPPYCFLIALPLAIAGGSGSPIRAVALVKASVPPFSKAGLSDPVATDGIQRSEA